MTPQEHVAWSKAQDAAGKRDAMGFPFTSWLVARYEADGRAIRDIHGRQVFETQAEHDARQISLPPPISHQAIGRTLDLFA